ncbi:hypothetical protein AMATHDRAFT_136330 [Amanita thiersii Skay4041]|uniref:RNA helicase n=1 Tax=Amanita thiersii Skay4041 TaxID=703135 RepID=A0A2A9NWS9_9AGAR|nr:hypothetical protein AMATHDRAFT_136330 [Amanita thiersii Skay4041]
MPKRRPSLPEQYVDSNAEIILPKSKEQKEMERKERLKNDIISQSESKWTSKKKKRLEKYIEKKLKKEERVQIFQKLAQTQTEVSQLQLQSSSTLGTSHTATNKELLEHQEDKEVRHALDGRGKRRKRRRNEVFDRYETSTDDEIILDDLEVHEQGKDTPKINNEVDAGNIPTIQSVVNSPQAGVGSALRRNHDGTITAPLIRRAKTKKATFGSWKHRQSQPAPQVEADSDTTFDSSDSAYDPTNDNDDSDQEDSQDETVSNVEKDMEGPVMSSAMPLSPQKSKHLGFKEWALNQLNSAKSSTSETATNVTKDLDTASLPSDVLPPIKKRKTFVSQGEWRGPLGEELQLPETTFTKKLLAQVTTSKDAPGQKATSQNSLVKKLKSVSVTRTPDVVQSRIMLPIIGEEQPIMEAILLNPVVIICGETGSGKTTQIPQFLYEAGFGSLGSDNPGMIGVTQPRRVAAMSMATRVAHELSLTPSSVSYQIRYDATVSSSTSIKFMTDGVLLRELATDFLLSKYSVIIIDEAHERSMNTDILIGVLSRVIRLREEMWKNGKDDVKPLRLVIMSATLRVSDFLENKSLFATSPPVINIAARQYPVTIHFNRRTTSDYTSEAVKKASKIHTRLPPGGILIFLTGQNEILGVCRKLEARFGRKAIKARKQCRTKVFVKTEDEQDFGFQSQVTPVKSIADVEAEDMDLGATESENLVFDIDDGMDDEDDPEALDTDQESLAEELSLNADEETEVPMHVIPLYSLLSKEKQMRVFQPVPPDCRLVVVSTNVAETSLTIPGIRYVIDCGRAKERQYDVTNGIQAFRVNWISKASAAQRAGRAGRVGPGHCYRLYSSALYENYFDKFSQPEILRIPIEGIVLQMKAMHIDTVVNFPFPTSPDRAALKKAELILTHLGALKPSLAPNTGSPSNQVTDLGKTMALFPLSPRFSRMLVSGQQHGCLPYVIAIVSAMSVGDPFVREEALINDDEGDEETRSDLGLQTSEAVMLKEARQLRRKAFFQSQSLHASLGKNSSDILKLLSVVGAYEYAGGGHKFCEDHFVRFKAMEEIHKLRAQINNIVQANFTGIQPGFTPKLRPPSDLQLKIIRQLLVAAFIDQVAVRRDKVVRTGSAGAQYANAKGIPYRAMGIAEDVFIHPSSVLANRRPPEYLIYHEIVRTTKVWLKGLTVVNSSWLCTLGKPLLCTFSKPIKNEKGEMMVIPRFGPDAWELPPKRVDEIS